MSRQLVERGRQFFPLLTLLSPSCRAKDPIPHETAAPATHPAASEKPIGPPCAASSQNAQLPAPPSMPGQPTPAQSAHPESATPLPAAPKPKQPPSTNSPRQLPKIGSTSRVAKPPRIPSHRILRPEAPVRSNQQRTHRPVRWRRQLGIIMRPPRLIRRQHTNDPSRAQRFQIKLQTRRKNLLKALTSPHIAFKDGPLASLLHFAALHSLSFHQSSLTHLCQSHGDQTNDRCPSLPTQ